MPREKIGIPKGTRDFTPTEVARREYIFGVIRQVYNLHGFMPIETPAMEQLQTLTGKYGDEGERLIFRILNSGDFAAAASQADWESRNSPVLSAQICEKALRYDLTVPFARYVVQHQHQIQFPFRRSQMQPVWRADRPQKGRYREFYQCDADVIGSNSLVNEAEFVQIIDEVFTTLGIGVRIHINNRKILAGLAEYIGHPDKLSQLTASIDKLEKTGMQAVMDELARKGLDADALEKLKPVLLADGTHADKIRMMEELFRECETGLRGLQEIREVLDLVESVPPQSEVVFDLSLARGLDYYTGAIIEAKALDVPMGSLCGGGRYDDLTGVFGLPAVSGVGISFGADRIYDVLHSLQAFPPETATFSQLLVLNFGAGEMRFCLPILQNLRKQGVRCELYPEAVKMKKQLQYADKNAIPYVLMVGAEELKSGEVSLKNMATGEQLTCRPEEIVRHINQTA